MPEVIFQGADGRLEGRFHPQGSPDSPIAIILHPHPEYSGTMNNKVVYNLHYSFFNMGFSCLRFNFRGVGKSEGSFDQGIGELADATSALDFLQSHVPSARACWVVGFSFGAWIGMQILMRRPEVTGFVAISPPANTYDFSFLAPCPSSGLIINGSNDRVVPSQKVADLVAKLQQQKGITITHEVIENANHFYDPGMSQMLEKTEQYVQKRLTENSR